MIVLALLLSTKPHGVSELHLKGIVTKAHVELGLRGHNDLRGGLCRLSSSFLGRGLLRFLLGGSGLGSGSFLVATFTTLCSLLGTISLTLFLFLFCLEEGSSSLLIIWHEVKTAHVGSKCFGNVDTLGGLVVLEDTAHGTGSGAHRTVEHVNVDLLISVLKSVTSFESTGLVVSTVRARDELTVGIVAREPSLKIVFLRSSIIELARNDIDNLVGEAKGLVKLL